MPSPSSESPFGDVLLCPVCMVLFEGRILQCSQGHAVCEKCEAQLSECPQCRGVYVGTRNYVLEEVIVKLKRLTSANSIKLGDEHDDTNISQFKNELTASIADALNGAESDVIDHPPPIQGSGFYECRILSCNDKLPICRLLNHLRYFHKEFLVETKKSTNPSENGDFVSHWTIPCCSFRKAFHLYNFGIYFLIVNVTNQPNEANNTNIKAWVQSACPNNDARNFRFSLELLLGDAVATFTDYVVGAQSDSDYIQSQSNCLNVNTTNNNRDVVIEMKISRNNGPKNLPRNNRTDYRLLPQNSHQQQANSIQQQTPAVPAPPVVVSRNRTRRRNRRR